MKKIITRRDILKRGTATLGLPWLEYFAGSQPMPCLNAYAYW